MLSALIVVLDYRHYRLQITRSMQNDGDLAKLCKSESNFDSQHATLRMLEGTRPIEVSFFWKLFTLHSTTSQKRKV